MDGKPTDPIFPKLPTQLFAKVLGELGMKEDREGNERTIYSLRHTYISMRLLEGADIYQLAKNCRTSVEMIEKHYAVHIKDRLDAAAINVRKKRNLPKKARSKVASKPKAKAATPTSRLAKGGQGG